MPFDPAFAAQVLRRLAAEAPGKTIALGAGQRTREVLQCDPHAARHAIAVIIDDDSARAGSSICNIPVTHASATPLGMARVLICSEMFERELTQRARQLLGAHVEIVTAFDRSASLASQLADAQQAVRDAWLAPNDREALWLAGDRLMSELRTHLEETPEWRYGPQRQLHEFRALCDILGGIDKLRGKSILNAGCGRYHPLGQSILAVLSGAARAAAIDIEPPLDEARSARAAAELIAHVLLDPRSLPLPEGEGWGEGSSPRDLSARSELLSRLEPHIELATLQQGMLTTALRPTNVLTHHICDIANPDAAPGPFDIIFSRDVFEHVHDVPAALAGLCDRLAPEGRLILWIDFSDHRRYAGPDNFAHWSALMEDDSRGGGGGDTNGLRFPHYAQLFTEAGFRVLRYEPIETQPIPAHVRPQIAPMYQQMTDADLAVCRAVAVLQKKASRQQGIQASSRSAMRSIR